MSIVEIVSNRAVVTMHIPGVSGREFTRRMARLNLATVDYFTFALPSQDSDLTPATVDNSTHALPSQEGCRPFVGEAGPSDFARVDFSTVALPSQLSQNSLGERARVVVPPFRGDPTVAPANPAKSTRAKTAEERIAYYRDEIRSLAGERAKLAPSFDAHTSALKGTRERLHRSHAEHPLFGDEQATAFRIALHDQILAASQKWGKPARRYREINDMIKALNTAIDSLERKAA